MSQERLVSTGKTFGRLKVVAIAEKRNHYVYWSCECMCGKMTIVRTDSLKTGNTKSCGCLAVERKPFVNRKHGLTSHSLYPIWRSMRDRCSNPKLKGYKNYGGRGISVCEQWKQDFICFFNWAMSNGWKDGLEIDRINNNGNYEPSNCRFVTPKRNANNRRSNRIVNFRNVDMTLAEALDQTGNIVSMSTVRQRLKYGWSLERALLCPVK